MRSDTPRGRILGLDLARTAALIGMACFHFGFDLESFGHVAPGTMTTGFWRIFARLVAAGFLLIAGMSLYLAHGQANRWHSFLKRWAMIVASAALVTVATYFAMGPYFIFFGILHCIALSSLIGLLFLRLPAPMTLLIALLVALAPSYLRSTAFDAPWLLWTGLSVRPVYSVDFEPIFPWLAPVLAGVALARIASCAGLWDRLHTPDPGAALRVLAWPGRHSLIIYLIHQPILIGIVAGLTRLGWL